MTEAELSTEIKTDTVSGIYFFWGDEDYMKNHRAKEIKKLVLGEDGAFDSFNAYSFVFGEAECDTAALADALMASPVMAERKFISVFFAALDSIKKEQCASLLDLLDEFSRDTSNVVVISATGAGFVGSDGKRPSPVLERMSKLAKCVQFAYQSEARLERWIERHFSGYGLTADPRLLHSIITQCGRSMYTLSGEVAKIAAHAAAAGKSSVDERDIAECLIKNDEDDVFALSNAILAGDTARALESLRIRMKNREDPIPLLGMIARTFSDMCAARAFADDGRDAHDFASAVKMNDYKARLYYRAAQTVRREELARAMELCRDADRQLKSGTGGYMPIERLICLAGRKGDAR